MKFSKSHIKIFKKLYKYVFLANLTIDSFTGKELEDNYKRLREIIKDNKNG